MPDPVSEVLQTLSTPPYDSGRLLLTGWFSFLDGEVTVGDLVAQRQVSLALGQAGVVHDTAWSAGFRPGAMTLDDADPAWMAVALRLRSGARRADPGAAPPIRGVGGWP